MPAVSHFLMLGTKELIASGHFVPRDEKVIIDNVTVKFRTEPKNVRTLYLVDANGTRIAELNPDVYDNEDLTWKSQPESVQGYTIPAQGKELGVEVLLQERNNGFAEELISVKWISMNVHAVESNDPYQLIAADPSYPAHQTVQARIESVVNTMSPVVDLGNGEGVLLGEVEVKGEKLDGAELRLNHITFTITKRNGVTVSNFMLGASDSAKHIQCSLSDGHYISCLNIPADIGMIEHGSALLQLWGDMSVQDSVLNPQLQIDILKPGSISTTINPGEIGDVRWSDGTGSYNWTELQNPIMKGSEWR